MAQSRPATRRPGALSANDWNFATRSALKTKIEATKSALKLVQIAEKCDQRERRLLRSWRDPLAAALGPRLLRRCGAQKLGLDLSPKKSTVTAVAKVPLASNMRPLSVNCRGSL
jgi:hypothetical protein